MAMTTHCFLGNAISYFLHHWAGRRQWNFPVCYHAVAQAWVVCIRGRRCFENCALPELNRFFLPVSMKSRFCVLYVGRSFLFLLGRFFVLVCRHFLSCAGLPKFYFYDQLSVDCISVSMAEGCGNIQQTVTEVSPSRSKERLHYVVFS